MMTVPLIFYAKAFMLTIFTTTQAEESDMEEKLKGLREEVDAAEFEWKRF
jgi:hypothetical protein